jgi:phosphoglycolate phosphatase
MLPSGITHVLFDLDGTLADTAPDLGSALNRLLQRHGRPVLDISQIRPTVSLGSIALVELGFHINREDPRFPDLRAEFLDLYSKSLADKTRLFPGAEELLSRLDERRLPWGIVTNKLARLTEPVVSALGLAGRARCVVSGDTTDRPKPDPAPLLYACRLMSCAPADVVYVGDARADIEAARRAGMTAVAARYGYTPPGETVESWGADAILAKPEDLLPWLGEA